MEKIIKLGEKELVLSSSVFTVISYQQKFGSDLYKDLQSMADSEVSITDTLVKLTRLIYVLALPNMDKSVTYEQFIASIPIESIYNGELTDKISEIVLMLAPNKSKGEQVPQAKR